MVADSKKALLELCFEYLPTDHDGFHLLLNDDDEYRIEAIENDLDTLLTLKKYICVGGDVRYEDIHSFDLHLDFDNMPKEDADRIKQWIVSSK